MLRTEMIAQIDAEIVRLTHARDILARPLASGKKSSSGKAEKGSIERNGKPAERIVASGSNTLEGREIPTAERHDLEKAPSVQLVPPKRRRERHSVPRTSSPEADGKVHAALSSFLPPGPIAVSAHEARKAEARNTTPPVPSIESEPPLSASSERSLGSLVRAFERSARLKSVEPL